jgi:hypothetical protein
VEVANVQLVDEGSEVSAEGEVANHSPLAQGELVVYALARRSGKIVAAGRAVVPVLAAGATKRFQIFFIGNAKGAQLQVTAPTAPAG